MIIGNPHYFSIIYEKVGEWNNDNTFNNGVLIIFLDSKLFTNRIINSTLNTDLLFLKNNLENIYIDKNLFQMKSKELYNYLYHKRYPSEFDFEEIYEVCISPPTLSDNDYMIFAVGDGNKIRLLGSKLDYCFEEGKHKLEDIDIIETVVDKRYILNIIENLNKFFD